MDKKKYQTSAKKLLAMLDKMNLDDPKAYSVIHELGDLGYTQAESTIVKFLKSSNPELRRIALNVLVIHWGMNQYAEICKESLSNDPSEDVRDMAASCLGSIYKATENKEVIRLLAHHLKDEQEHWMVRQSAYDAILRILNYPFEDRPSMSKKMDFQKEVDWELVNKWSEK